MNTPSDFRRVARDIMDLCELQMQLLSVDSQEARQKAARALACVVIGAAFGASALTVALLGCGYALAEAADWPVGVSMLVVAGVVLAFVLILLAVAYASLRSASRSLQEFRSEFVENVKWLKATLISPSSSPRNQFRSESFPPAPQAASVDVGHGATRPLPF